MTGEALIAAADPKASDSVPRASIRLRTHLGVVATAVILGDDTSPVDGSQAGLVRFDAKAFRRLRAAAPTPYHEALPAVDRRAAELDELNSAARLDGAYETLRAQRLADGRRFTEEWLTRHLWQAHIDYWGCRQRAAFEVGFALGRRQLREIVGGRLVDHHEPPGSRNQVQEAIRSREAEEREQLQEAFEHGRGRRVTADTPIADLAILGLGPKSLARMTALGVVTLRDAAERWNGFSFPAVPGGSNIELRRWIAAVGLALSDPRPGEAR